MRGATVPVPVQNRSGSELEIGAGSRRQPMADHKRVASALQLWSVRLIVSLLIGSLLIIAVVEAIRLRSYYLESGWVARLGTWYEQQAAAADKKSEALRRQAGRNNDSEEASRLEQEATALEQQSHVWKQQAQQAREAGSRRPFDWFPQAFSLSGPGG